MIYFLSLCSLQTRSFLIQGICIYIHNTPSYFKVIRYVLHGVSVVVSFISMSNGDTRCLQCRNLFATCASTFCNVCQIIIIEMLMIMKIWFLVDFQRLSDNGENFCTFVTRPVRERVSQAWLTLVTHLTPYLLLASFEVRTPIDYYGQI